MLRRGTTPYLECSTRGDKRFSPFCAYPTSLHGVSIENAYHAMKVFDDGSTGHDWRSAKAHQRSGRHAINLDACRVAYDNWWREYIAERPDLLAVLKQQSGLSDMFGQEGHACQADILWQIRCEALPD